METLRCPKCLTRSVDGGAKRCPACGARLKTRGRSEAADDEIAARPRALVESELQARIEAQTANGFRQRRRAAKTARRIAALPPSLFEAGAAIARESWNSEAAANPVVIDLPMSAFRDAKPAAWVESEAEPVSEPELLALVAPVVEITPAEGSASEPEPEGANESAATEAPPGRAHGRRTVRVEHRWRLLHRDPPR